MRAAEKVCEPHHLPVSMGTAAELSSPSPTRAKTRPRFFSEDDGFLWFKCEHPTNNEDGSVRLTRLADLKDASDHMVLRKVHMDASGNRSVRRISPIEKTGLLVTSNNRKIALFRIKEKVYAIEAECPHKRGPLALGDIEDLGEEGGLCVVCPWHKWTFELQTGRNVVPAISGLAANVFPVRLASNRSEEEEDATDSDMKTSRSRRGKKHMKEIDRLRLTFRNAEVAFQRAAASSPRTFYAADMKLRSAKSALQRYLDFADEASLESSAPLDEGSPLIGGSAHGVTEEDEEAEGSDEVAGADDGDNGEDDGWIFRRNSTWSDTGLGMGSDDKERTEKNASDEYEDSTTSPTTESPLILVGFPQFDSSIFTRTDF